MFGPKQDPYHTRPGDEAVSAPSHPQDEADQAREQKKRKWLGRAAEVAADVLGAVIEGVLDNMG